MKTSKFVIAFSFLFTIQQLNAQPSTLVKKFEGVWQVSLQRGDYAKDNFAPPQTRDFKIFDDDGNFRHIINTVNGYTELSKGKILITSDSTYKELLDKHLAAPGLKEGKVVFKFQDNDTFFMKWVLGSRKGEEVYKRIK